jgi:hypothetical protein
MNSSEVKKTIWLINFAVVVVLGLIGIFVYKQLLLPPVKLKPFEYIEPKITEKTTINAGGVSRSEVENVFNWKPTPPPPPPPNIEVKRPVEEKPVVKVSNINNMFELQTILGRLAFILIKKDKLVKSVVEGDEILDGNGEALGILKEVRETSVIILLNGKIETLFMEGMEQGAGTTDTGANLSTDTNSNVAKTALVAPVSRNSRNANNPGAGAQEVVKTPVIPAVVNMKNDKNPENNIDNVAPAPKEVVVARGNFNGHEFAFEESKDEDGIVHRKISEEMAVKLQAKESIMIFTDSNNYDLVFQSNGVVIKNIKNEEVKKFFNAFGISESDVILSVNGQSLGNKSEDDLISLYHQILDSAKYATIEMLKNGVNQKFRVSTDKIKKATNK